MLYVKINMQFRSSNQFFEIMLPVSQFATRVRAFADLAYLRDTGRIKYRT